MSWRSTSRSYMTLLLLDVYKRQIYRSFISIRMSMHMIAISSTADVKPIGRHPPIAGRKCDNLVVTSILVGVKDFAITQDLSLIHISLGMLSTQALDMTVETTYKLFDRGHSY